MKTLLHAVLVCGIVFVFFGCSGHDSSSPKLPLVNSVETTTINAIPVSDYDGYSGTGIFGAYELVIDPENINVELTPMRELAIGESFIVSGTPFFTNAQCFRIKSIALDSSGGVMIAFEIKHPFPKGNPSLPPSATNRLDLDLFDLALVIFPKAVSPTSFQLNNAYTGFVLNADGYTKELNKVSGGGVAAPYKICYESSSDNRFAMGTNWQSFDVLFSLTNLQFTLYLTMGYGASARASERLHPTYYIPEFNRKAAWKVKVYAPSINEYDSEPHPVWIDIYDWNHGATVAPNYPDPAHTNWIKSKSDVSAVRLEVPGMFDTIINATTEDTSTNGFSDPLSYMAEISNENNLTEGEYVGLVKVTDTRIPSSSTVGSDFLIHTPDGLQLINYTIPEYATYQSFKMQIVSTNPGLDWGVGFGSDGGDEGWGLCTDSQGNVYIAGFFEGTVDFDPSDAYVYRTSHGSHDAFVCKLTRYGDFIRVLTWGSTLEDDAKAVAVDSSDNLYVTGFFEGTADFNPGTGTDLHTSSGGEDIFLSKFDPNGNFLWARTFGNDTAIWDEGHGVSVDLSGNVLITGDFGGLVDFDPGPGTYYRNAGSVGYDAFVSKFDPNGNFIWARTWGSIFSDAGRGVDINNANEVFITGGFQQTVDFDPGSGTYNLVSSGLYDAYVNKLDSAGNFVWARKWGGPQRDFARGIDVRGGFGTIYVVGYFEGTSDFDPGTGTDWRTSNGGRDIFVTCIDPSGNHLWAQNWGGMGIWDEGNGLCVKYNDVLVTGCFEETVDFDPGSLVDEHTSLGGRDIFLSCFSTSGTWKWSYTWGTYGIWDEGHAVGQGSYLVTGAYDGTMDFDPGPGQKWNVSQGSTDIFLIKIDDQCESEIEPNDTCTEASTNGNWMTDANCGIVRYNLDEADYWRYDEGSSPRRIDIFLLNKSGYNIDLYVYESDCSTVKASSTNGGANDEFVSFMSGGYLTYFVKVVNNQTGYNGALEYELDTTYY